MDARYIAGLFDGEGSISLRMRKNRNDLTFEIRLYNSSSEILAIKKETHLSWNISKNEKDRKKIVYVLSLTKMEEIHSFLSSIIPFLRIKKRQAETMFSLIESRQNTPKKPYTREQIGMINLIRKENWRAKKFENALYEQK